MNPQDRYWLTVLSLHGAGWLLWILLHERMATPLDWYALQVGRAVLWVCLAMCVMACLRPQDSALRITLLGTQAVLTLVMLLAYWLGGVPSLH